MEKIKVILEVEATISEDNENITIELPELEGDSVLILPSEINSGN